MSANDAARLTMRALGTSDDIGPWVRVIDRAIRAAANTGATEVDLAPQLPTINLPIKVGQKADIATYYREQGFTVTGTVISWPSAPVEPE